MGSRQRDRSLTIFAPQAQRKLFALSLGIALLACTRADVVVLEATGQLTPAPIPARTDTPLPSPSSTATRRPPSPSPAIPTQTFTPSATPPLTALVRLRSEPSAPQYLLPLRVQHLTPTSATLLFELRSPSAGFLLYRRIPAHGDVWIVHQLDPAISRHQIQLEGLQEGQPYQVQIGLGSSVEDLQAPRASGKAWGPIFIRTPRVNPEWLRVGVVGDSGYGDKETRDLARLMASKGLDLVLHTGDLVYRSWEDDDPPASYFLKFFIPFQPLLTQLPIYPVVGNHDLDTATSWGGDSFYFRAFPAFPDRLVSAESPADRNAWYAFSYGQVQFLMLNTQAFFGDGGRQEQNAWLAARLEDTRFRWSIAVSHVPPYTSGRHTDEGRPVRSDWLPLFRQAGVPLTFSGHDHNYERLDLDGIISIVTGGGSTVLYGEKERLPQSQAFHRRTHFVLLEISGDRIVLSAIDLDGDIFDRSVIRASTD